MSKLEKMFFTELNKLTYVDLEKGRNTRLLCDTKLYVVDYLDASINKIIEIYGYFWHMKPTLYHMNDVNSVTKKLAKDVWESDNKKEAELKRHGYEVLVIWEDEISSSLESQLEIAKQFLESK